MKISPKKSKKQKTLDLLMVVGKKGIHSFIGAREISHRFAAYVGFLRDDGYDIVSVPEKMGGSFGVRYFLKEAE